MKNYTLVFYAEANFNSTNIISSISFECKSVTTAYKMMDNYMPKDFIYYKLYDNGICRGFGTKEQYSSNKEYEIAQRERNVALRKKINK